MRRCAPWLLAVVVAAACSTHTVSSRFVWEDHRLVVENRYIRSTRALAFVFSPGYWRSYHISPGRAYKPLAMASYGVDFALWGLDPRGFHLTNVALHVVAVLLVTALARALMRSSSAGLFAALLFACHPVHAEAVGWIKNRSELLAAVLILASCVSFARWSRRGTRCAYWAALMWHVVGLGAKGTSVVVAPLVTLVAMTHVSRETRKRRLRATAPFWVLACGFLAFRVAALEPERLPDAGDKGTRPSVVGTMAEYVRLTVFPIGLSADREMPAWGTAVKRSVWAGAFCLLGIMALMPSAPRARWAWGVAWFFLALAPAANLRPIYGRPIAEQRLYVPSVGACVIVAALFAALLRGATRDARRRRLAHCAVLLVCLHAASIRHAFAFSDNHRLWLSVVRAAPDAARPLAGLGEHYAARGWFARAHRLFARALYIDPQRATTRNAYGVALMLQYRWQEAAAQFRGILDLRPDYVPAHMNLSFCLLRQGEVDEAQREAQATLKLDSDNARAHLVLGWTYELKGRTDEAIWELRQSIGLSRERDADTYCRIASLLLKRGEGTEAAGYYRAALRRAPGWAAAVKGLERFGEDAASEGTPRKE